MCARAIELLSFRSTSLKLQQSQKPLVVAPDVIAPPKLPSGAEDARSSLSSKKQPPLLSAVVTIKPKKRTASSDAAAVDGTSSKKLKGTKTHRRASKERKKAVEATESLHVAAAPTTVSPAPALDAATSKPAVPTGSLLLLGYSSSSDSE